MSSDAFVAPPISQLGTQYIVVTSIAKNDSLGVVGPFVIAIVATVDNTQVTVQCNSRGASLTLTSGALNCTKGSKMTLTLNRFQTAEVSSYFICSRLYVIR
jgi:IgGFc binding protein